MSPERIQPNGPVPPECLDDEQWPDRWGWRCPSCGRYIAADAVTETDYLDNGAYYGVNTRVEASCARCGAVEPKWEPTHWTVL